MKKLVLLILVLVGIMLVTGAGLGWWYWQNSQPVNKVSPVTEGGNENVFVVARGQSIDRIGDELVKSGLIRSALVFKIEVYRLGLTQKIQAGTFRIPNGLSTSQVATKLTQGKTLDFWVTLLEGWRREEIADAFKKAFDAEGLNFDVSEFLNLTEGKEGRLFPDSYLVPVTADEKFAASLLENTFTQKTKNLGFNKAPMGLTTDEVLTLASIVEREARQHESRRMVAGILLNRLEIGMALQVDASLQYIKGNESNWWPTPLAADKALDSKYNTYAHPGLPPGPIANPSLSSIEAVLQPIDSDYLYYITGNDNKMHYGETLDEHNENINRYL